MNESGNSSSDDDCTNPFASHEYTIVAAVDSLLGFVSFLACLFVIAIIIIYKKYLFFTQRMILYLAIAALLISLVLTVQITQRFAPNDLCILFGFLVQLLSWSELLAVVCITINVLLVVVFHRETKKLEIVYVLLIFVLPLTFNWIPFTHGAYGVAGPWCWIRSHHDDCSKFEYGIALQATLWYAPFYTLLLVMFVIYAIVLVKLRRDSYHWASRYDPLAEKQREQIRNEVKPLLWFPIIYLASNTFVLVNDIQGAMSNEPVLALSILAAITFPLQGGFITVAFTLDPKTFKRLKWTEFKAALMLRWNNEVSEYEMKGGEISDSYRHRSKTAVVKNEAVAGSDYVELKNSTIGSYSSST